MSYFFYDIRHFQAYFQNLVHTLTDFPAYYKGIDPLNLWWEFGCDLS